MGELGYKFDSTTCAQAAGGGLKEGSERVRGSEKRVRVRVRVVRVRVRESGRGRERRC